MSGIGVAHLTALELDPFEFVLQSARAGFSSVGLRLHPAMAGGVFYPLKVGSDAQGRLKTLLKEEGVHVQDIEFVELKPDIDIMGLTGLLETGADLGARSLTVSGDDDDAVRLTEHFAALCELAAGFGIRVDLEFMRWRAIGNLEQAERIVTGARQPNAGILIDALHLHRSGGSACALGQVASTLFSSVQLCDAPAQSPPEEGIILEARAGRLPPGAGGLPLGDLMKVLPADIAISIEMPSPRIASVERLELACRSTRAWLTSNGR
ncbi:sugar phosphate isomerase/epimerase family protein [Pseudomonas fluorescens]|uniref:Xylose isomerase-like TIM barrel domain-containing protein n=1 Tax=Pseudomonas fluorescens TaxID=294 RepID=A0A5E6ZWV5_PSEFL|nr:TIM barrel protein [Pseudomonas fluorescens]VVN70948.1 hypothetical protein PS710_00422 [Pseudomonas fluorescens]